MPKKVDSGSVEVTFLQLNTNIVFLKGFEHKAEVKRMFLFRFGVNNNIIDVNHAKLSDVLLEYLLHKPLEGGWSVGEPERHHQELVGAQWGPNRSFCDGVFGYTDLPITPQRI